MGTDKVIRGDEILIKLEEIKSDFEKCKIEETPKSKYITSLLEGYISLAKKFDERNIYMTLSRNYSDKLKTEFSNLISEIERSLEEMRSKDKQGYLREILNNEVRQLDFLSSRVDVLETLESIRDQLKNVEIKQDKIKGDILSKLKEFIKEAEEEFSATELEENKKRSKNFSAWLQHEFRKLIRAVGTEPGPQKTTEVKKEKKDFPTKSQTPSESGGTTDKLLTPGVGMEKTVFIVLIVFLSVAFMAGLFFLYKKFGKKEIGEGYLSRDEKEKGWIQKKEQTIKGVALIENNNFPGKKALTKDDIFSLKREMTSMRKDLEDLKKDVDRKEHEILETMQSKFKEINRKLDEIIKTGQEKNLRKQKQLEIDKIENPFAADTKDEGK
jgi:hypothetical protein